MFEPAEYHHGFVFSGGKPAVRQVFRELLERKILEYKMEILEYDLAVKVFRCHDGVELLILRVVEVFYDLAKRLRRAVIHHDQFPIRAGLSDDTGDGFLQETRLPRRHDE